MKVFIIGATGFIGGTIARALIAEGHKVIGLARTDSAAQSLAGQGIEPAIGDLTDHASIRSSVVQAEATVWVARSGIEGAITPQEVAQSLPQKDSVFVFTTGAAAYPDTGTGFADENTPLADNENGRRMMSTEQSVLDSGVGRKVVVRPTLVYGQHQGGGAGIRFLIDTARTHGASYYPEGLDCRLSTVHVSDLADLYVRALTSAPSETLFNAAAEPPVRIQHLAEAVAKAAGVRGKAEPMPVAELAKKIGPMSGLYTKNMVISSDRARTLLGWEPSADTITNVLSSLS